MHDSELRDVARERNWMRFGQRLLQAMEAHRRYGRDGPEAVLAAVARMRGQHLVSQRRTLAAVRFLQSWRPAVLAAADPRIGCSQVHCLAKLHALSPGLAAAAAPRVFRGDARQAEMMELLARAKRSLARAA